MAKQLSASKAQMLVISSYEETSRATRLYHPRIEKVSMAARWVEFYSFLKLRRETALLPIEAMMEQTPKIDMVALTTAVKDLKG